MLVTDVGDEVCWQQLRDVGDFFSRFRHQHPLFFNISFGHQYMGTNNEILSPISTCHQHLWSHMKFKIHGRPSLKIFG